MAPEDYAEPYLIVRWQKNRDYRTIRIYCDLFGDWFVEESWGDGDSHHQCRTLMASHQAARAMLLQINRKLRSQGFKRLPSGEEQLAFGFDPL